MGEERLTVAKVTVKDVRAVELLEQPLEHLTEITGATGSGKSSILEAIAEAMGAKSDRPRLVREGAPGASVVLELSDGTTVSRTFAADGKAGRAHVTREGMSAPSPQAYIDALLNPYSFNPVRFLTLPAAEQGEELLRLLNLEIEPAQYTMLGGGQQWPGVNYDAAPLDVLQQLEKAIYDQRRDLGRDRDRQKKTAEELSSKVPPGFDAEVVRELSATALSTQLAEARAANDERTRQEAEVEALARKDEALEGRINGIGEQIAQLQRQQAELETERGQNANRYNKLMLDLQETAAVDTSALESSLEAFDQQKAILSTYTNAVMAAAEAATLAEHYDDLTALISRIRATPATWLADAELPVEGLSVDPETGELTIDGRPLAAYSDGEKVLLAIRIAKATAGKLRVLLVDDLEKLDEGTRDALLTEAAADDDLQWIVAWAAPNELTIRTVGGDAG